MKIPLWKGEFGSKVLAFCLLFTLILGVLGSIPGRSTALDPWDYTWIQWANVKHDSTQLKNFTDTFEMKSLNNATNISKIQFGVQSLYYYLPSNLHLSFKLISPDATMTSSGIMSWSTIWNTTYSGVNVHILNYSYVFTPDYEMDLQGTYYFETTLAIVGGQSGTVDIWTDSFYIVLGGSVVIPTTPAFDAIRIILGTISIIGLVMSPFAIAYQIKHGTSGRIEGALWLLMLLVFFGGFFMAFVYWT